MTDPNMPPPERPAEPVHHTTINNNAPADSGGGGFIPFLVIGLIVVLAIVAWFLFSNGSMPGGDTDVDVNIEAPKLPDMPRAPDLPDVAPVQPPAVPAPAPATAPPA